MQVLIGKVIGIVLTIVNNVLLARLFGPANFGVYTLFLKTCNVGEMLSQLGTNAAIVKFVGITSGAEDWGRLKGVLRSTYSIAAVGSVLVVLIFWLVREPLALELFDSPELLKIMIFCFLILPLQSGLMLVTETFRGLQDLKTSSFLPVLQQAVFLILLVLLCVKCIIYIQNVLVALSIAIAMAAAFGLYRMYRKLAWYPHTERVKAWAVLKESLPMMVTRGALLVISSIDVYVLGIYTNTAEVGIYGVVASLATLTVFSLSIINQVIPAMIAHYNAQKDFETLSYVIRFASTLGFFFSAPALIILFLLGEFILTVVFGPQYSSGVMALNFLIISQLINAVTGSCGFMLQMTGHHMSLTRISVCCGIINFVLNIALVRDFGKEGVAAATGFSLALQNILVMVMAKKKTGIWTLPSVGIGKEMIKQARRYIWNLFSR